MTDKYRYYTVYFWAILLALLVNCYSWHLPFFWDTMLTSGITQQYLDSGFDNFIPSPLLDAGHPPLFYIYVTLLMKAFGKSLWVVHLSILPFTVLGILSFIRILDFFSFSKRSKLLAVFLFFSIPAVLTQQMMVSYDMVLMSLYLTAIYAILYNRRIVFALVLILMVGISLRGLVALVSIFFTLYILKNKNLKSVLHWMLFMMPAVLIATFWYSYHRVETGWWLSTPSAAWSGQRGFVNTYGLFKNVFSIVRCFFDFGIVILSVLSCFQLLKTKITDKLVLIWMIPLVTFGLFFLPFRNPINHRYFLLVYVLMVPGVVLLLERKKFLFSVLVCGLLFCGNYMIYPGRISNGWDCSLAHHSYFPLRKQFNEYFIQHKLDKTRIGTTFPMNASFAKTDFTKDTLCMFNVNGDNMDKVPYVLYTNICNDFSDEQLDELSKWKIIRQDHRGLVTMFFLQNPNFRGK